MDNWDRKFIKLCKHISGWSKDKNRKVGADELDYEPTVLLEAVFNLCLEF